MYPAGILKQILLFNPQGRIVHNQPFMLKRDLVWVNSSCLRCHSSPPLQRGRLHGIMAKVVDCHFKVSRFKLQLYCCIHFWINTIGKGMKLLILPVKTSQLPPLILSRWERVTWGPEVNKRPYWFMWKCKKKAVIKASLYAEWYSLSSLYLTLPIMGEILSLLFFYKDGFGIKCSDADQRKTREHSKGLIEKHIYSSNRNKIQVNLVKQ